MAFFFVGLLGLLFAGSVFLASIFLLLQIMVWRKRGWKAEQWIRAFWIGCGVFLIGCFFLWIAHTMRSDYSLSGYLTMPGYLLVLASPICQFYAFVKFFQEQAVCKREEQQALMRRRGDLETTGVWPPPPTND